MTRLWIARLLVVFSTLVIGLIFLFANTGVREVHQSVSLGNQSLADSQPGTSDWPSWRGTDGSNIALSTNPPLTWSVSENVKWKSTVPGRGHSSPILWGERLFLSTADDEQHSISLLCFDQETGRTMWQTELHRGGLMEVHQKNSQASSTPVCDGKSIYVASVVNGALWVTAVDFTGRIEWQHDAGPYSSEWGYGSSVMLHKSVVIVSADNRGSTVDRLMGSSWLAALNRSTGEIAWRVKRVEGDSFGSAIIAHVAGRDQLLLAGKDAVISYDPLSGNIVWKCRWGAKRTANTVAFDQNHVFASTRQPQGEVICIRADGEGDVTATHLVWNEKKIASDVPSPCAHGEHLYALSDDGVLTCVNAADGSMVWKRRLGGSVSASPLIAGDHLFCCNEDGQTFVVKLSGRGEVVAENTLDDGILASPIVSRDRLFIRTLTALYCIAAPHTDRIVEKRDPSERRL